MTAPKTDELPTGTKIGRYEIVRRIGSGGMGAVYEGKHTGLKKRVAIKVLHSATAQSAELSARFVREGEAAARIRHPHVVDIYDVGSESDLLYLVMEFLEGEDLGMRLHREGMLSPSAAADVLLPVIAAVGAAHEVGIVHRDLKPANLFLAKVHGAIVPKVLDFGISKILKDDQAADLTSSGALLGTPYYMSPEQAQGAKVVTQKSDQYSLGVILYQCVTGARPFFAESMYQILHKIVIGQFDPPRKRRPDLSAMLERSILRAMANAPDHRFPDLTAFGASLIPFASDRVRAVWEPRFGLGSGATEPAPHEAPAPSPSPPVPVRASPAPDPTPAPMPYAEPLSVATNGSIYTVPVPRSPAKLLIGAAAVTLLLAGGTVAYFALRTDVETAPIGITNVPLDYDVDVTTAPEAALIELDGTQVGKGRFQRTLPRDGHEHRIRVSAPGHESATIMFRDQPPPQRIQLEAIAAPPVVEEKKPAKPAPVEARPTARAPEQPRPKPAAPKKNVGANAAPIIR